MLGKLAGHRADDRQLIDYAADVRKQVTDWDATLAIGLELPGTRQHRADIVELGGIDLEQAVGILAGILGQPWLGVEAVNL